MNIHRQTFEEILNLDRTSWKDRELVNWTPFRVTFRNFGKIFPCEDILPPDAAERQRYAEEVAGKYDCKVSHHAIYTTSGNPRVLDDVRNELMKTMYVSPILWTPVLNDSFSHFRTFAFGFFPYCNKRQFVYNPDVSIESCEPDDCYQYKEITTSGVSTDALHRLMSQRIKLSNASTIWLGPDTTADGGERLCYHMLTEKDAPEEQSEDATHPDDMSPQDYFQSVVRDCGAEEYVLPEYKMLFCRLGCKITDKEQYDTLNGPRMSRTARLLARRLNVSDVYNVIYKDYYCLCMAYDDEHIDEVARHLDFFGFIGDYDYGY